MAAHHKIGSKALAQRMSKEIKEYLLKKRKRFSFRVHQDGTPFQRKVWNKLREIPYGKTWSYAKLAREIGCPRAVRAVGNAVGKNKLLIVVPCHRVIRSDGSVGGYAGGPKKKKWLLALEKSI